MRKEAREGSLLERKKTRDQRVFKKGECRKMTFRRKQEH